MEGSQPLSEFDLSEAEKWRYVDRAGRHLIRLLDDVIRDGTKKLWWRPDENFGVTWLSSWLMSEG